jgi:diadenosine tetraphosphate (Ap4A) HIT family hydrolase
MTAPEPVRHAWLICQDQAGEGDAPGGNLLEEDYVVVFHVPPGGGGSSYVGHLLVTPRRHCSDFAGLDRLEAEAVGAAIATCSAALKKLGKRFHITTIGHGSDRLHLHLLPRSKGTPDEVPWHTVRGTPWRRGRDHLDDERSSYATGAVVGVATDDRLPGQLV